MNATKVSDATKNFSEAGDPLISFVLLNYNNADYTLPCVASIRKGVHLPHEIVVVDNGSRDEDVRRLRAIPAITLVCNKLNRGFTGGNNDGVRASKGAYVAILNNDTVVDAANLDVLGDILPKHGRWDVIGGRIVGLDGKAQTSGGYEPSLVHLVLQFVVFCYKYIPLPFAREHWFSSFTDDRPKEIEWASGCFFVMRRDAYLDMGGFDENIFIYLDEVDLHRRVRARGGRVVLYPDVRIKHYGQITWRGRNHVGVRHNFNSAAYFLGKHRSRAQRSLFLAIVKGANLAYLPILVALNLGTLGLVGKLRQKLMICWTLLKP